MFPRSMQHYFYADGSPTHPTVTPTNGFSPNSDAERLFKSFRYLGTDEDEIVAILGSRTSYERMQIAESFKTMFSKDLASELESELSLDFRRLCTMMMRSPWRIMAEGLHDAIHRTLGTREKDLIHFLISCSNDEIKHVKSAYEDLLKEKGVDGKSLKDDISGDTFGYFEETLELMLDGRQDEPTDHQLKRLKDNGIGSIVNEELAQLDVKELYECGEGSEQLGTKDKRFLRVIVNRTIWQSKLNFDLYMKEHGKNIIDVIDSETSGDFCRGIKWIAQYTLDRPKYFAKLLHDTMAGPGTKDHQLMRLVILRSEIDMDDIKVAYETEFGETLEKAIKSDTSGDYKHLLLALCGYEWKK
ncbi:hypothetical protein Ciccas_002613 [Cichlidogyrus casuarinus]|uniref:Annexin n=1 Tax=Cichlidogyrus casuarinus TaxID=1844966 RepID=A0ABD2QGS1_9PLAT